MADASVDQWTLIPAHTGDIERLREQCRRLVRRRAALAAGMAAVPLPGVDMVSDVGLFTRLVDEVNRAFGLDEPRLARMAPRFRVIAYEAALGVGGMLVGKVVTRGVVLALLRRAGVKSALKTAARVVPVAGQLTSAAIGFAVFRKMGYQHVDACAEAARKLLLARAQAA